MKHLTSLVFIVLSFPVCTISLAAQSVKELNAKATQEYVNGNHDESLRIWYDILEKGNTDPDLYFNIGNSEAMKGNVSNAILYYERALRYKPGNEEILKAIGHVRAQVKNAAIPVDPFFLTNYIRIFLAFLRPGHWAFFAMLFLLIAVFFWLVSIRAFQIFRIKKSLNYRVLFGVGMIFILIAVASYHQIHRSNEGIIFSECDFREAPSAESPLTRSIHPGEKITIIDELSGWYKVNLVNLDEGWIRKNCFIRI
jgi:tetratricopeptide (TPR) repeat protein